MILHTASSAFHHDQSIRLPILLLPMTRFRIPTAGRPTKRGLTLLLSLAACTLTALAEGPDPCTVKPAVPAAQHLFPQGAVRVLEGPFKTNQDIDLAYLMRFEPDRLLAQFRVEAGLEPKAKAYGGWETPAAEGKTWSLAGHTLGHYLSALSLMYRLTDDERLRERVAYIVAELKECQAKRGDGSLVAFPYLRELEADIKAGKVETITKYWAPFYTIHKELGGLRDAWVMCGDATAREVPLEPVTIGEANRVHVVHRFRPCSGLRDGHGVAQRSEACVVARRSTTT